MTSRSRRLGVGISLLALVVPAALVAQGAQIEALAYLGRNDLTVGQQFILTVEVKGAQRLDVDPILPDLSGFAVMLGSGTSLSRRVVNGRTTVSLQVQYRLQATAIGSHVIGPITVEAYGTIRTTEPIELTIAAAPPPVSRPEPRAAPAGSRVGPEDVFITAEASRDRVLQNEPVIIEYRIYARVNVTSFSVTEMPATPGFWVEVFDLPPQPEAEPITLNGQRYVTALIRKVALFPTSPGTRTIEPMEIEVRVRTERQRPRNLFDDLFSGSLDRASIFGAEVRAAAKSQTIEIEVLPLPDAGRPPGFSGLVGSLSVTTSLDRDSVAANEAVTMRVDVSGSGNLRAIARPELDLPPTVEAFPPEATDRLNTTDRGVTGTRSYEYVLIPRAPGELTIPGIDVTYYDPAEEAYRTASSAPLKLTVSGRANGVALPGIRSRGAVESLRTDVRFIEIDTPAFERIGASPFSSALFWLVLLTPIGAVGGAVGLRRRRDRLSGDVALARARGAGRVARKRLARARDRVAGTDTRAFYAETGQAIEGFVADRLNVAAAGMIRDEIRPALEGRGATEESIREYLACLDLCDRQRFSPAGSTPGERRAFLARVEAAMSDLHQALDR